MSRYIDERNIVSSLAGINAELEKIANTQADTLSRKGDTPNQMETNLDMDNFRIINLPPPISDAEPLRQADIDLAQGQVEAYVDAGVEEIDNSVAAAEVILDDKILTATQQANRAEAEADASAGSASASLASAIDANNSQQAAANSATNAFNSATSANLSLVQTQDLYDQFDDRYLGSKSTDPALDNDNLPLLTGALYWNSVSNQMFVYTGSTWVTVNNLASSTAAAISAAEALVSASNAQNSEDAAFGSAGAAESSANAAFNSASASAGSASQAANYAVDALDARDASVLAKGLSESARDAAVVAQGLSEDARDAAVVAQGLSEDARDAAALSAIAAADSADEAESWSLLTEAQQANLVRLNRSMVANPDSADASLLADFGRKGYGVGDDEGINKAVSFAELFTFTRASNKTAIDNASGLLVTVPANEPAFSYSSVFGGRKPLTIHEARTNIATRNKADANALATWTKTNVTVATVADPQFGNVIELTDNAQSGRHAAVFPSHLTSGSTYTRSVRFKKPSVDGIPFVRLSVRTTGDFNESQVTFDAATGVVVSGTLAHKIKSIGDYFEVEFSSEVNSSANNGFYIGLQESAGVQSYIGTGKKLLIALPQMELGAFATPPIETEATTATRAADVCTIDDLSGWFNPSEGTFVIEFEYDGINKPLNSNVIGIGQGTSSSRIEARIDGITQVFSIASGVSSQSVSGLIVGANALAFSYDGTNIYASLNGGLVATLSLGATNPALFNRLIVGGTTVSISRPLNGAINFLDYKDYAATDAQLIEWSTI